MVRIRAAWCRMTGSAVLACACASAVNPSPEKSQVLQNIPQTLAVAPVRPAEGVEVSETALARIDSQVVTILEESGVSVVSTETYSVLWSGIIEASGGFYDPFTGELVNDRFEAARNELFAELRAKHGAEAVLYPELEVVGAEFGGRTARWDGARQSIPGKGNAFGDFLDGLFGNDGEESGVVSAVSLTVFAETTEGEALFDTRAGIELLDRYEDGRWVTREDLLSDLSRTERAVRRVLDPLIGAYARRAPGKSN